jgi:hypothetical protein
MKNQSVNPAIAVAAVVIVLVIVVGIGWKFMAGGKSGSSGQMPPEEAKKWKGGSMDGMAQHYRPANGPPAGYNRNGMPGSGGR